MQFTNQDFGIARIGSDGWNAATEPPDSNRFVQIAWDNRSYGSNSLGFYDKDDNISDPRRRYWWSHPRGRVSSAGGWLRFRLAVNRQY